MLADLRQAHALDSFDGAYVSAGNFRRGQIFSVVLQVSRHTAWPNKKWEILVRIMANLILLFY